MESILYGTAVNPHVIAGVIVFTQDGAVDFEGYNFRGADGTWIVNSGAATAITTFEDQVGFHAVTSGTGVYTDATHKNVHVVIQATAHVAPTGTQSFEFSIQDLNGNVLQKSPEVVDSAGYLIIYVGDKVSPAKVAAA